MSEENEITRIIDDYVDGQIDHEGMRRLLEIIRDSDEARQKLAILSVIERLIKSRKAGPVSTRRIMESLSDGKAEEVEVRQAAGRKPKPAAPRKPEKSPSAGRKKKWNRASSAHGSGIAALVTIIIMSALGFGLWREYRNRQPDKPPRERPGDTKPGDAGEPGTGTDAQKPPDDKPIGKEPGDEEPGDQKNLPEVLVIERPVKIIQPTPAELKPPDGDGSSEPGFVPPPEGWDTWAKVTETPSKPDPADTSINITEAKNGPKPPVLFIKLKEEKAVHWNTTPNDVRNLLSEIGEKINARYIAEERMLDEVDPDPEKNPILYKSGHYHFVFTRAEREKLRKFMTAGGMLVFNSGLGSKPFYESARRELRLIFPETPIQRLSADHALFNTYYNTSRVSYMRGVREAGYKRSDPWFEAVTINCRTVALISRWDMSIGWEGRVLPNHQAYTAIDAYKLGVNVFSYATAFRAWANNYSQAMRFADADNSTTDKMFLVQMIYDGEWKTRHAGLSILLQSFNRKTTVPVKFRVREMGLTNPAIFNAPLLYITGHENFSLSDFEIARLRKYIQSGGFVFAEACCGRRGFDVAFRTGIARVIPGKKMNRIPPDSVIFSNPNRIAKVTVTSSLAGKYRTKNPPPLLEGIKLDGRYVLIYSRFGMAGGWEMSPSPYSDGYLNQSAMELGQNILMYAITQ